MPTYEFKSDNVGPTLEVESKEPLSPENLKAIANVYSQQASKLAPKPGMPGSKEPDPSYIPGLRTRQTIADVASGYKGLGQAAKSAEDLLTGGPLVRKAFGKPGASAMQDIKQIGSGASGALKTGNIGPVPMYAPGGPLWNFQSSIPQDIGTAIGAFKQGSQAEQWTGVLAPILEGLGAGGVRSLLRGKKVAPGGVQEPTMPPKHPTLEPAEGLGDKPKWRIKPLPENVAGPIKPEPQNLAAMKEMLKVSPETPVVPGGPTYAEIFDYDVPTDKPRVVSWAQRLWKSAKEMKHKASDYLPQDYNVHKENPGGSAVMYGVDRAADLFQAHMEGLLTNIKNFTMESGAEWMDAEEKASLLWRKLPGAGDPAAPIPDAVLQALPPGMRAVRQVLLGQETAEKEAAAFLGERILPREPGYVTTHIADRDYSKVVKIGDFSTGVSADLRATLGAFEKPRDFATMAEGMRKGVKYADPRLAALYRIYAGQKLIHTSNLIQELWKDKVLFKSAKAAAEAKGKAFKVEGIPGTHDWYAGTESEAKFLADNLRAQGLGGAYNIPGYGKVIHYTNKLFRNFQLMNPFPHILRNILYKYAFSGASVSRLPRYLKEYQDKSKIETLLFEKLFPLESKDVLTPGEMLRQARYEIGGKNFLYRIERIEPTWSRNIVFNYGDRFMKYARFREHLKNGVNPLDAQIQTQIDLIRYSDRSRLLDFWKSVPMNYFATWRYGTVQSLYKNIAEHPFKSLAFVAAWDLLRETIYRGTGVWMHSPIDYVEGPAVDLIEKFRDAGAKGGAEAVTGLIIGTVGLGPGGHVQKLILDVMQGINQGKFPPTLGQDFIKALWGFSILLDPYSIIRQDVPNAIKNGDAQSIINVISSALVGAHNALNYRPRRLGEFIPEDYMPKSNRVKAAEQIQERRQLMQQRQEEGRGRKPHVTIEDMVRGMQ